eukprot:4817878-Pyramimonas_sp.AAC.1
MEEGVRRCTPLSSAGGGGGRVERRRFREDRGVKKEKDRGRCTRCSEGRTWGKEGREGKNTGCIAAQWGAGGASKMSVLLIPC